MFCSQILCFIYKMTVLMRNNGFGQLRFFRIYKFMTYFNRIGFSLNTRMRSKTVFLQYQNL